MGSELVAKSIGIGSLRVDAPGDVIATAQSVAEIYRRAAESITDWEGEL